MKFVFKFESTFVVSICFVNFLQKQSFLITANYVSINPNYFDFSRLYFDAFLLI